MAQKLTSGVPMGRIPQKVTAFYLTDSVQEGMDVTTVGVRSHPLSIHEITASKIPTPVDPPGQTKQQSVPARQGLADLRGRMNY